MQSSARSSHVQNRIALVRDRTAHNISRTVMFEAGVVPSSDAVRAQDRKGPSAQGSHTATRAAVVQRFGSTCCTQQCHGCSRDNAVQSSARNSPVQNRIALVHDRTALRSSQNGAVWSGCGPIQRCSWCVGQKRQRGKKQHIVGTCSGPSGSKAQRTALLGSTARTAHSAQPALNAVE